MACFPFPIITTHPFGTLITYEYKYRGLTAHSPEPNRVNFDCCASSQAQRGRRWR